jgi:signal peptidase II
METLAWWLLPLSLTSIFLADQVLKSVLLAGARVSRSTAVRSIVRIQPVHTDRTMAGRLGVGPVLLSLAWLGCLLTVLLVIPHAGHLDAVVPRVALGSALGGAAGNLFDVLVRRGVVDYVELGAWPAFNLADVAIVSGVIGGLVTL